MDMDQEADALLARIRTLREELRAGRLSARQVEAYRDLGRQVDQITRQMDEAPNSEAAERLWIEGAQLIRTFLDENFGAPTVH